MEKYNMNNNKLARNYGLKLIDFQNFAGARIDRSLNRENGIKETSPFWVNLPNTTVYMPSNPFKMTASFLGGDSNAMKMGAMTIETLNLELVVAISSNLKLDLVDLNPDQGQEKIRFLTKSKRNDNETHYIKFEGKLPPLELSLKALRERKTVTEMLAIEDWTITDFDNCLNGNPHV